MGEALGRPASCRCTENVRSAGVADLGAIGRLLDQFNPEYDERTPGSEALAGRVGELLEAGDTEVLLAGGGPDGLAVLRFRPALWDNGSECNLAELYVVPSRRGIGLGRALLIQALVRARERAATTMDIFVDEPDLAARHLYETAGFSNRSGGPDGPLMFFYEREL